MFETGQAFRLDGTDMFETGQAFRLDGADMFETGQAFRLDGADTFETGQAFRLDRADMFENGQAFRLALTFQLCVDDSIKDEVAIIQTTGTRGTGQPLDVCRGGRFVLTFFKNMWIIN